MAFVVRGVVLGTGGTGWGRGGPGGPRAGHGPIPPAAGESVKEVRVGRGFYICPMLPHSIAVQVAVGVTRNLPAPRARHLRSEFSPAKSRVLSPSRPRCPRLPSAGPADEE